MFYQREVVRKVNSCDLWTDHLLLIPPPLPHDAGKPPPASAPGPTLARFAYQDLTRVKSRPRPPGWPEPAARAGMVGGVSSTCRHGTGYTQVILAIMPDLARATSGSQTFVISVAWRREIRENRTLIRSALFKTTTTTLSHHTAA